MLFVATHARGPGTIPVVFPPPARHHASLPLEYDARHDRVEPAAAGRPEFMRRSCAVHGAFMPRRKPHHERGPARRGGLMDDVSPVALEDPA
jgi:hypothetical protein